MCPSRPSQTLTDLVDEDGPPQNNAMRAEVVQRVDKVLHVILHEQDDDDTNGGALEVGTSVNARIVEAGLATVERRRERFLQSLVRFEKDEVGRAGGRGGDSG